MVENYNKKHYLGLLDFIKHNSNEDFYITSNNRRTTINDEKSLKELLEQSRFVRVIVEKGDVLGIILLWKSQGNNVIRYYVKLNAINKDIAENLLVVALWNSKEDLFTKVKKDSKFLPLFRNKGFEFVGFRGPMGFEGSEIFLKYSKFKVRENINGRNQDTHTIFVGG